MGLTLLFALPTLSSPRAQQHFQPSGTTGEEWDTLSYNWGCPTLYFPAPGFTQHQQDPSAEDPQPMPAARQGLSPDGHLGYPTELSYTSLTWLSSP